MSAENEIIKLSVELSHLLAELLRNFVLPAGVDQVFEFSDRNLKALEQNEKFLKRKVEAKVTLSKDSLGTIITMLVWTTLSIGRVYNNYYLKGHTRRDFIKEAIAYDKQHQRGELEEIQK